MNLLVACFPQHLEIGRVFVVRVAIDMMEFT